MGDPPKKVVLSPPHEAPAKRSGGGNHRSGLSGGGGTGGPLPIGKKKPNPLPNSRGEPARLNFCGSHPGETKGAQRTGGFTGHRGGGRGGKWSTGNGSGPGPRGKRPERKIPPNAGGLLNLKIVKQQGYPHPPPRARGGLGGKQRRFWSGGYVRVSGRRRKKGKKVGGFRVGGVYVPGGGEPSRRVCGISWWGRDPGKKRGGGGGDFSAPSFAGRGVSEFGAPRSGKKRPFH